MALAEARAIWQRTANRCLVQEDAKRAPKLACCSPMSTSTKPADTGHTSAPDGYHIPKTGLPPFNRNPTQCNSCPTSKWWVQMQPNSGYPKILMETCEMHERSENLAMNEDIRGFSTWDVQDKLEVKAVIGELNIEGLAGYEGLKEANGLCLHSQLSWIGTEENAPWWRTADAYELELLVAQRSLDYIENCDLPHPQNHKLKKDVDVNMCCFSRSGNSSLLQDPKPACTSYTSSKLIAGSACQDHCMPAEGQKLTTTEKPLRDDPAHERMPETLTFETNATNAKLLEALCHLQTRAREAERAAKLACAENEHVIKLALKQGLQLFAYEQWLQLLQLENMCLESKSHSLSILVPMTLSWTNQRTRKIQKSWQMSSTRRQAKRSCGKYAVVFAIGLGLMGAGFLLGSTIGQMQPTW